MNGLSTDSLPDGLPADTVIELKTKEPAWSKPSARWATMVTGPCRRKSINDAGFDQTPVAYDDLPEEFRNAVEKIRKERAEGMKEMGETEEEAQPSVPPVKP